MSKTRSHGNSNNDAENLEEISPSAKTTKSGRTIKPNIRLNYLNKILEKTPTKRSKNKYSEKNHENSSCSDYSDNDEKIVDEETDEIMISANDFAQYEDDGIVPGNEICKFRTPKKKGAMFSKAQNTPKTPSIMYPMKGLSLSSPRTPKTTKLPNAIDKFRKNDKLSTPLETRNKNKKQLNKLKKKITEETDSESSADEHSDYEPDHSTSTETSDSDESDKNDDGSEDDDSDPKSRKRIQNVSSLVSSRSKRTISQVSSSCGPITRGRTRAKAHDDFIPDSDNYFIAASNKKIKTSDHTLDRLRSSRLQHDELFSLLNSIHISMEHEQRIGDIFQDLKMNFNRWMLEMSKGYNIITYGCGSKQQLLHAFCETHLADKPLIIINGFFPSLTVKDILLAIKIQLLDITNSNSRNDHECIDVIASALDRMKNVHIFIVINNIDGVMLRKTKDQHIISRLAKIKNVHLIASIDHINAPLLWDQTCMDNFNFVWYDCTTLLPYKNETAFENSVFFQNSVELDLAAMSNVFQSLTTNARGIYMILVKFQLANQKDSNFQGMTFKDLYHKCRENFLVSSDSNLRTQLIEFVDHHMIKIKRSHDGTEQVTIPISTHILAQFIQLQNE